MGKREDAKAIRAGAKTEADFALYEYVVSYRSMMSQAKRKYADTDPEPFDKAFRHYDLLIRQGRFFEPLPRPRKYERGKVKQCFGNSLDLAVAHEELTYCEGLVLIDGLPIPAEHGWCISPEGKVVDVTLKEPACSHFGIPFDTMTAALHDLPLLDGIVAGSLQPSRWQ